MKSISVCDQETMYLTSSLASVFGHANGYLRIEWHTVPMVSREVRLLFGQILNLLRQEHFHRLFTERTSAPPLSAEDCQWMALEWVPRATQEAGLTHCAIVESTAEVVSHSHRLRSQLRPQLQFRFFDNYYQAEAWIREAA